jgi:putative (di)nucleoside polyphosphate hydrolase
MKKLPLRPNVCMLVYNKKRQLLLGKRINRRNHWQFPQGGAEAGVSLRENVVRELREELGIKRKKIGKMTKLKATHQYDWKKPPGYASGKWRGQSQTFWLVEFLGTDSDIDLDTFHEPEFKDYRWCSVAAVKRLAARERLPGYTKALKEFSGWLDQAKRRDSTSVSKKQKATKRTD